MNKRTIKRKLGSVRKRIAEVVIGLEEPIELLIISMLSGGHVLVEGPPGLGKTTLANTVAKSLGGSFSRIQMTPDLLPSDIIGINVFNPYDTTWVLRRGPIFANVVLIDELNRASPKVQSAFLQAMQEREVTIENETMQIIPPFMVIATQVPQGELGTYSLTGVQIDRFAYRLEIPNPSLATETSVLERIDEIESHSVEAALTSEELLELMNDVKKIHVESVVKEYIVQLVHYLRDNDYTRMGPSPRASIWILKGSRAYAMLQGRDFVIPDDVKAVLWYVIPHRLELTAEARIMDISTRSLVQNALDNIPVPKGLV